MNPSRPPASRPSLPSAKKPSREGPSVVKPTWEELQARVESLEKKKRSVKRKAQAPPESRLVIRGKILMLGASSPPSTAKEWGSFDQVPARGQAPPLEVLPIFLRSPPAQNSKLPPTTPEDEGRDCFGIEGDEDSLLTNSELAAGLYHPSYETLTSRGWMPCPLRSLSPYCFRERPPYVRTPLFVCSIVDFDWPLPLFRFCRWLAT